MDKPKFKHDCSCCTFLGVTKYDNEYYDLYFCAGAGMPTVIARFSDEGPDYMSGMNFGVSELFSGEISRPLAIALQLAYQKKLITVTIKADKK